MEQKRKDPELGYFARQALRLLDDLIANHGGLAQAVPPSSGGTLRIELNHIAPDVLPVGMRSGDNDARILAGKTPLGSRSRRCPSDQRSALSGPHLRGVGQGGCAGPARLRPAPAL